MYTFMILTGNQLQKKIFWGLVSLGGTGRDDISNIHAVYFSRFSAKLDLYMAFFVEHK